MGGTSCFFEPSASESSFLVAHCHLTCFPCAQHAGLLASPGLYHSCLWRLGERDWLCGRGIDLLRVRNGRVRRLHRQGQEREGHILALRRRADRQHRGQHRLTRQAPEQQRELRQRLRRDLCVPSLAC